MESAFKKVRLIQWALLLAIPLFASVAEIARSGSGSNEWTSRHWLAIGFCIWSIAGAFRLRSRLLHHSKDKLMNNAAALKAVKRWEAAHLISLASAEGIALWGLAIRIVLHGTFWQASIFYVTAVFLLLLWRPHAVPSAARS